MYIQKLSNVKWVKYFDYHSAKYHMQQCITRMPVPIVPTKKVNLKYAYRQQWCWQQLSLAIVQTKVFICNHCNNAYKICHLQLLHTKVVICYCCIQKLSQLWRNFAIFSIFIKFTLLNLLSEVRLARGKITLNWY